MKFCSQCGGRVEKRLPEGDDRERWTCTACDAVHYQNPIVVVGCLVERQRPEGCAEILLCRRGIEPAHGRWTVPAGFLELGETIADGAARETREEAGADVRIVAQHSALDLVHIGQHYAMFRAALADPGYAPPDFPPGSESLECRFFGFDELPWDALAFPAVHFALELRRNDVLQGVDHMHHGRVQWNGTGSRFDAANYEITDHMRTPLG